MRYTGVYIVHRTTYKDYKIGYSSNIYKRLTNYQSILPECKLVAWFEIHNYKLC